MTDFGGIHVEFPQYSAKFERIETGKTVTIIISCPLCGNEVLRRDFENVPDELSEISQMTEQARAVDRESYWAHLVMEHPEHFDESAS